MSVVKSLIATSLAFGLVSLVGCSSEDPDPTPPVVSNLSHTDNQKIIGSRSITVSADASDETDQLSVTVTLNGTNQTVTDTAGNFSVDITLEDNSNNVIVITASDADNSTVETITLNYPFLAFEDGPAATVVLGQENFESFDANRGSMTGPAINTLYAPLDVKVINGNLYIADRDNHRVLGFSGIPTQSGADASFVIGYDDFVSNLGGTNNNQLAEPQSITHGDGHFFIGQRQRIHHWAAVPLGNDISDIVFGQTGFVAGSNSTLCEQDKFGSGVSSIIYANGKLIAADFANHRILIWNTIPTSNGVVPDVVVGQQDLTHCVANTNTSNVTDVPSASNLKYPGGVWSDGARLVVSDPSNHRVLIWNEIPTSDFTAANIVLGQANLNSAVSPASPTATNFTPHKVYSNGNQLFVVDAGSTKRVLIWDQWPTENNVPANRVIGAAALDVSSASLGNNAKFSFVESITSIDNKLIVPDADNNRVLIFEAP